MLDLCFDREIMARALLFIFYREFLVTGADTGAAGTAYFDPGGVAFWSKAKKTRRGGRRAEVTQVRIDTGP